LRRHDEASSDDPKAWSASLKIHLRLPFLQRHRNKGTNKWSLLSGVKQPRLWSDRAAAFDPKRTPRRFGLGPRSGFLYSSFCDPHVCVSQVKAILLNVIKALSHINARLGCSSGQIYGLEGGPWRVARRKIGSVAVGRKAEYAVRPPEYVNLHYCLTRVEMKR
jgi:hypothetical protein